MLLMVLVGVDGKYGSALRFNGSGYVAVPFSSSFDVHDEITVEGWVNLGSGQSSSSPRFVDKDGSWLIHFSQSPPYSIVFNVYRGGQLNQTSTDAILSGNTWHNVACTFNSFTGQGKIYVDGVLKAVSTFPVGVPIDSHPSDVIIGDSKVHNRQINGTIDEFNIYNRVLTDKELLSGGDGVEISIRNPWIDTNGIVSFSLVRLTTPENLGLGYTRPIEKSMDFNGHNRFRVDNVDNRIIRISNESFVK